MASGPWLMDSWAGGDELVGTTRWAGGQELVSRSCFGSSWSGGAGWPQLANWWPGGDEIQPVGWRFELVCRSWWTAGGGDDAWLQLVGWWAGNYGLIPKIQRICKKLSGHMRFSGDSSLRRGGSDNVRRGKSVETSFRDFLVPSTVWRRRRRDSS